MNVIVRKVLGGVFTAHKVENNIRVLDRVLDRLHVSNVHLDKVDHTQVTLNLQVALLHLLSVGNDSDSTSVGQSRGQVIAEETTGAENSSGVTGSRRSTTSTGG